MTHTLGPWHIGMHPGPIIYGADSSQVADCRGDLLGACEAIANMRLIAAAPDLLAALEAVDKEWSEFWPLGPDIPRSSERVAAIAPKTADIWRGIRSAIARAKGQS